MRCYYNRLLWVGKLRPKNLVADTMAPGSLFIPNAAHRDVLKVLAKLREPATTSFSAIQCSSSSTWLLELVQPVLLLQAHPAPPPRP